MVLSLVCQSEQKLWRNEQPGEQLAPALAAQHIGDAGRKGRGRQGVMPQRMSWATAFAVPWAHLLLLVKGDVCMVVSGFEACRL